MIFFSGLGVNVVRQTNRMLCLGADPQPLASTAQNRQGTDRHSEAFGRGKLSTPYTRVAISLRYIATVEGQVM